MFNKLKELFNKKKSSESDDEVLDFSNYSNIHGDDSDDPGTSEHVLAAIKAAESLSNPDKTIVPEVKTEILERSIKKDSSESTAKSTSKFSLGKGAGPSVRERLEEFAGKIRSKQSDGPASTEEGPGSKKTIVRFILILLIATVLAILIDDEFSDDTIAPEPKVIRVEKPPKFKKPMVQKEIDEIPLEEIIEPEPETEPSVEPEPSDELEEGLGDEPEAGVDDDSDDEVGDDPDDKLMKEVIDSPEEPANPEAAPVDQQPVIDEEASVTTLAPPVVEEPEPTTSETSELEEDMSPPVSEVTPEDDIPVIEAEPLQGGLTKAELIEIEKEFSQEDESVDTSNLSDLSVNYLSGGSGLVYNCVGKHWACISKTNFAKCKKLSSLSPKRCFVFKYYNDKRSCQVKQIQNIDANRNIDFCY